MWKADLMAKLLATFLLFVGFSPITLAKPQAATLSTPDDFNNEFEMVPCNNSDTLSVGRQFPSTYSEAPARVVAWMAANKYSIRSKSSHRDKPSHRCFVFRPRVFFQQKSFSGSHVM